MWYECASAAAKQVDVDKFAEFVAYRKNEEPKGLPSREVGNKQLLALERDIAKFRSAASMASDMKAVTELPEVAPGSCQDFLKGKISTKFPYIWPYVFAGSFIVMGNSLGDDPIVAFYNPYFDVAILTTWRFDAVGEKDPSFYLMEAIPVSGRAFVNNRATRSTDQPIWSKTQSILEIGFVRAAQSFTAAFEKRYPPFGLAHSVVPSDTSSSDIAIALIEERVFFMMGWVFDAQNASSKANYAGPIKQFKEALSASSPENLIALLPKGNPQDANLFFRFDHGIREGMKPYLVVNEMVIFIAPNLPQVFVSIHFEPDDVGYKPGVVALFNLLASYPNK